MTLALSLLGCCSLLELLLYISPLWRHVRRVLAAGLLVILAAASGLLVTARPALASIIVLLISLYRIFNLLRLVEGRMHVSYLRRVTFRTSLTLMAYQLVALGLWALIYAFTVRAAVGWLLLSLLQLALTIWLSFVIRSNLMKMAIPFVTFPTADRDLPSISVCIPARNETEMMDSCLRAILANDYPKLEILVLDDQSHDRTPEIIRGFAHDGVRFISGKEPPESWLAKNWAYQRLYEEASGELLIFAGVDVRFGPKSLRAIVTAMRGDRRRVISFMPENTGPRPSTLLQPIRYAWELCLTKLVASRPPVLSTCWAAEHEFLEQAGGFAAVASAITPEAYFARRAGTTYTFAYADDDLALTSQKGFHDQWDTAVRTRYPQLHRRPELVLALSLVELTGLVLPVVMLFGALFDRSWPLAVLTALALMIQSWTYARIVRFTYRRRLLRGFVTLPIAVILDIVIRHYSMWRYEFGRIVWKDRDVTTPIMHVVPHLPKV